MKQPKFHLMYIVMCLPCTTHLFSTTETFHATHQKVTPTIKAKMIYTWNEESPIPLKDLRYLTITHYDFEGNIQSGELVIHKKTVCDLLEIFEELFHQKFPIQSMKLVDEFEGSDDASMEANNTSAFYARRVAGTTRWSNHSFGTAIDINPYLNPYSKKEFFCPKGSARYLDRTLDEPGMITKDSPIYKAFKKRGWEWGGECFIERDETIDRHHFQKIIPGVNKNTN